MTLKVGDPAPNFKFINKNGLEKNMYDVEGKKIIFFFPKAFSNVCTIESNSIQASYNELLLLGVGEVFGISLDKDTKLEEFCYKFEFEYTFVSDANQEISRSYKVFKNKIFFKYADRITYIVNENNRIEKIFENGVRGKKAETGINNHGEEIAKYLGVKLLNDRLHKKMEHATPTQQ
ncbi:MAG: peroxiredoxin [Candidatus Kariarchaeaceae archaeon]|jgi:peroxiredoxin Q/BCP